MEYELDREPSKEPALHEMVTAALNSLVEATSCSQKGQGYLNTCLPSAHT